MLATVLFTDIVGSTEQASRIGDRRWSRLHTGEVQPRGADVGGIAVHVAARVMGAAGDGEVLVSRTVRDLVAGSDVALEGRGSYALKGIAGDWQPFAIRRQQTREVPP